MRDFTISVYKKLLEEYILNGYHLCSYEEYLRDQHRIDRIVILRHDVDRKPRNAVVTARLEQELGVTGTYYFRAVHGGFEEQPIREIIELGHEIGYHYEDMALFKGNDERALDHFVRRLEQLRKWYPVKTVCMHGSPLSRWDNRLLWKEHDYQDYGLLAEPYFDLDFNEVLYLTDTGRRWDGVRVSVRDTVDSVLTNRVRTTREIMTILRAKEFPDHIMQNIHPQRWNEAWIPWLVELASQNVKNVIKNILIRIQREKRT